MLIARAANNTMINNDSRDCIIIKTFAQRANTGVSAGDKAVLVVKAKNK